MSTQNEYLQQILTAVGGNINDLPDNLKSTLYTAIILKCGGTVDDLPDGLETTYLKRIAECVSGGGNNYYDEFWDAYQNNGNPMDYGYSFCSYRWNDELFTPKYDINATNMAGTFKHATITNLTDLLKTRGVRLITSKCVNFLQCFQSSTITHIPELDLRKSISLSYTFACGEIIHIEKLIVSPQTTYSNSFTGANNISHLIFEGEIGQNGLNLQWSKKLTKESLLSVLTTLKDYSQDTSGTTYEVTIGAENKAKLTNEELEIAWNKGWEVL